MVTVIDATNLRLGRLASIVAKGALDGEDFVILNCESAVISGSRVHIYESYDQKRKRGSTEFGPYFPRRPDHIMKRTIRGMVPYKRQRGAEAMKRIQLFVGVPEEFEGVEVVTFDEAHIDNMSTPKYVTLGSVSDKLGAKY